MLAQENPSTDLLSLTLRPLIRVLFAISLLVKKVLEAVSAFCKHTASIYSPPTLPASTLHPQTGLH